MTKSRSPACVLPLVCAALVGASLVAGCGSTTVVCDPLCPAGFTCTESGCEPDSTVDLAVGAPDLSGPACGKCGESTPHCGPKGVCVPCLVDEHCGSGQVCKTLGSTTVCLPGCNDDARCGGGTMKCCGGACIDTATTAAHCGACGMACSAEHGASRCVAGMCQLSTCSGGWADCNNDTSDGCETNLNADPNNCTACGSKCSIPNGIAGCANECYLRACYYGFDDCDGDVKNGCETNVQNNQQNCGACGKPCVAVPHARNTCVNGACQLLSCDKGFADCDGNAANGCEVQTDTDARNCGACGNACGLGLICAQALCTCPQCNLPNAKSTCVNLKCAVAQCNTNWGDCDGQPQNGCERDLTSDAQNCGQCGKICAQGLVCTNGSCTCPNCVRPNARTSCVNNMCQLDSCFQGFGNCNGNDADGCETDVTTSKANCGACGNVCPNNLPNCVGGMCVLAPQLVGSFKVSDGPAWAGNPPCYTCQEACAKLFGGASGDYSCSTQNGVIDHKAWADGWGDTQHCKNGRGGPVDETYKLQQNYNCGAGSCSFSTYVMDHGCADENFCYR